MFKNKKDFWFTIASILITAPILGENILETFFGDVVSRTLCVISCVLVMILGIKNIVKTKQFKLDFFLIVMLIMILQHTITTFLLVPDGTKVTGVNNLITPYGLIGYWGLLYFIKLHLQNKKRLKTIFSVMAIIMTFYIVANLLLTAELHFADNIATFNEARSTGYTNSRNWAFGHRNLIFIHHLIWLIVSYIACRLSNIDFKKIFVAEMFFTIMVGIISWNATMLLITAIIFILCSFRNNLFKKINILYYLFSYLTLQIGIVFLRIQNLFSFIIVDILHRNLSFTGRTTIWNSYIDQFANGSLANKLFGNFGVPASSVNTHNMFLGLLSFTGITGLLMYFSLIYKSAKSLFSQKNTDLSRFIAIIIFGFLLNSLTMEFYLQPLLALYIGYKAKDFNKLIDEEAPKQIPTSKVNLLYTINFVTNGGPTRVLENLVKELDQNIYNVTILTLINENDPVIVKQLKSNGIKVIELNYPKKLSAVLKNKKTIIKKINALTPDIVHTHGIVSTMVVSDEKITAHKTTTIHNNIFEDYRHTYGSKKGPVFALIHIYALKKFDDVICCSETSYKSLRKYVKKATFIRNGITSEAKHSETRAKIRKDLNIKPSDIVYIYVGVINSRKRVTELVNLFNDNLKQNEHLIIVGDGELYDEARSAAKNQNIIFTGKKTNAVDYLNAADIYVSNSSSEGFSISVIEALESGLLLLLSDIPSHKECFKIDKNVYLGETFNNNNFKAQKKKLENHLANMDKKLIKAFQKKHLSSSAMSKQYEQYYEHGEQL